MDITQDTIVAGIAIAAFKAIEYIVKLMMPKNSLDNKQETEIAVLNTKLEDVICRLNKIETNDLAHINAKLDMNGTEHRDLFVLLSEIKGLIKK